MLGLGAQRPRRRRARCWRWAPRSTAWDDAGRARVPQPSDVPLRDPCTGDFAFDALVLSPGIPHRLPHAASGGGRARACRRRADPVRCGTAVPAVRRSRSRARFVGITGTNGKSTTTALIAHILECAPGARWRPAAISAPPRWRCRCCRTTASMCWRCRPTCWSDSPPSASMPRRCSISAPTISIATATWRAISPPSSAIFDRQQRRGPGCGRRRTMRTHAPWRTRCMPGRHGWSRFRASRTAAALVACDREAC